MGVVQTYIFGPFKVAPSCFVEFPHKTSSPFFSFSVIFKTCLTTLGQQSSPFIAHIHISTHRTHKNTCKKLYKARRIRVNSGVQDPNSPVASKRLRVHDESIIIRVLQKRVLLFPKILSMSPQMSPTLGGKKGKKKSYVCWVSEGLDLRLAVGGAASVQQSSEEIYQEAHADEDRGLSRDRGPPLRMRPCSLPPL